MFVFRLVMDHNAVSVHKLEKKKKKEKNEPISSHLDLMSLVNKRFTIQKNYFLVVHSGQDSASLPARVANHNAGFNSSCPLTELTI